MDTFLKTLTKTNQTVQYYLDKYDLSFFNSFKNEINELNRLLGNTTSFNETLRDILKNNPRIIEIIPLLVATRENSIDVLIESCYYSSWVAKTYSFSSNNNSCEDIENIIEFFDVMGLKDMLMSGDIADVYTYILGVHIGLRASARKNKGGTFMENYTKGYIDILSKKYGFEYLSQATSKSILERFNIDISNILKNRKPDFVINNNGKLILIEVNFYNTVGSKIKSTSNEYIKLGRELQVSDDIQAFIWITDGKAWLKEKNTLSKALEEIEHVININTMISGYIETMIN